MFQIIKKNYKGREYTRYKIQTTKYRTRYKNKIKQNYQFRSPVRSFINIKNNPNNNQKQEKYNKKNK